MGNIADEIKSNFATNRLKAYVNILYTANWLSNEHTKLFKPFGISTQQYNILRILRGAKKSLKVQDIKSRMVERAPNVTRLMDKLCDKDLIERIASNTDRRVVNINITSKGIDLLAELDDLNTNDVLKKITEEEAEQLSNLLDKAR